MSQRGSDCELFPATQFAIHHHQHCLPALTFTTQNDPHVPSYSGPLCVQTRLCFICFEIPTPNLMPVSIRESERKRQWCDMSTFRARPIFVTTRQTIHRPTTFNTSLLHRQPTLQEGHNHFFSRVSTFHSLGARPTVSPPPLKREKEGVGGESNLPPKKRPLRRRTHEKHNVSHSWRSFHIPFSRGCGGVTESGGWPLTA